jgi:cell division septal protein FtsQ
MIGRRRRAKRDAADTVDAVDTPVSAHAPADGTFDESGFAPRALTGEPDAPTVGLDELREAFGDQLSGDVVVRRRPGPTDDDAAEPAAVPERTPSPVRGPRTTIVIGGDELPDAVYVDAELDRTGPIPLRGSPLDIGDLPMAPAPKPTIPRYPDDPTTPTVRPTKQRAKDAPTTIVIGDELEASGAFDAVAPPSSSMDPRVRARRVAVNKAKHRKRLWWAVGIGLVVVIVVGTLAVLASPWFSVDRVVVQGDTYTTARNSAELDAVVASLRGEPVLLVDTLAAEDALEQIAWVERAFVRTRFPDTVIIDLRERIPLATFAGSDGRYRVIDRDGRVLDVLDGRPVAYVLLDGAGPDLSPGQFAGPVFAAAAQLVGALPAEIASITTSATVDATTGDLGLVLDAGGGPITVRLGDVNGLDAKLARLLQQVRDGLDGVVSIDVATDDVSVRTS